MPQLSKNDTVMSAWLSSSHWMSSLAGSPLDALLADPGMTAEEVARREHQFKAGKALKDAVAK